MLFVFFLHPLQLTKYFSSILYDLEKNNCKKGTNYCCTAVTIETPNKKSIWNTRLNEGKKVHVVLKQFCFSKPFQMQIFFLNFVFQGGKSEN